MGLIVGITIIMLGLFFMWSALVYLQYRAIPEMHFVPFIPGIVTFLIGLFSVLGHFHIINW